VSYVFVWFNIAIVDGIAVDTPALPSYNNTTYLLVRLSYAVMKRSTQMHAVSALLASKLPLAPYLRAYTRFQVRPQLLTHI